MSLIFPPEIVDSIIPIVLDLFNVNDALQDFFINSFLPELRNATSELHLELDQKTSLLKNMAGTLVKLIYAFVWQEDTFTFGDVIFSHEVNTLGSILLPLINDFGNSLTSWELQVFFNEKNNESLELRTLSFKF